MIFCTNVSPLHRVVGAVGAGDAGVAAASSSKKFLGKILISFGQI